MILILKKLKEAIEFSRDSEVLDINENIKNNQGSLFLKAKMSKKALDKWQEVAMDDCEWLKFSFSDSDQDEIEPSNGNINEEHTVKIEYPCFDNNIYILTLEGWKYFLYEDGIVEKIKEICLLFAESSFATGAFRVSPWQNAPINLELPNTEQIKKVKVRSFVKIFSTQPLTPNTVEPWILTDEQNDIINNDKAFQIWKEISTHFLIMCLPNEIYCETDGSTVIGLSGKPPKKLAFNTNEIPTSIFDILQETIRWIYLQGDEIELKHTFFSGELAREWPVETSYCNGLIVKVSLALESARLLYKAHIRSSSKDTLKALSDLRKNLADDMQKIVQQSKELTSSLWKDIALVISTIVIKYTLDASKAPASSKIYALVFFAIAVYILVSHFTSVFINSNFIKIIEENRIIWRKKLYAYLDDKDYHELATTPIENAYKAYRLVNITSTTVVIILAIVLFYLGFSEFMNVKDIFLSITKKLSTLLVNPLQIMANLNYPPLFYHYK
ncbi:TPA: hypothetical protein ACPZG0_000597 [Yersinia enterocolitica]